MRKIVLKKNINTSRETFNSKEYLGRSPLNEDTNMCEWLGVDIDIKIPPKTFCADVWSKLGTQYFPFMTLKNNGGL